MNGRYRLYNISPKLVESDVFFDFPLIKTNKQTFKTLI